MRRRSPVWPVLIASPPASAICVTCCVGALVANGSRSDICIRTEIALLAYWISHDWPPPERVKERTWIGQHPRSTIRSCKDQALPPHMLGLIAEGRPPPRARHLPSSLVRSAAAKRHENGTPATHRLVWSPQFTRQPARVAVRWSLHSLAAVRLVATVLTWQRRSSKKGSSVAAQSIYRAVYRCPSRACSALLTSSFTAADICGKGRLLWKGQTARMRQSCTASRSTSPVSGPT